MVNASGTVMTSNPRSRRKLDRRASAVVFPPHGPPVNTNLWKGADFVRRFVSAWVRFLRVGPFVVLLEVNMDVDVDVIVVELVGAPVVLVVLLVVLVVLESALRVSSIDWERHLRD
jgi:hypothetical protein